MFIYLMQTVSVGISGIGMMQFLNTMLGDVRVQFCGNHLRPYWMHPHPNPPPNGEGVDYCYRG